MITGFRVPHQIVPCITYNSSPLSWPHTETLDSCQTHLRPFPQGPSLLMTCLHTCHPCGMSRPGHFLLPCPALISLKTAHGNLSRPHPFDASLALKSALGPKHPGLIKFRVCVHGFTEISCFAQFTKPVHILTHDPHKASRAVSVSSIYKWKNEAQRV